MSKLHSCREAEGGSPEFLNIYFKITSSMSGSTSFMIHIHLLINSLHKHWGPPISQSLFYSWRRDEVSVLMELTFYGKEGVIQSTDNKWTLINIIKDNKTKWLRVRPMRGSASLNSDNGRSLSRWHWPRPNEEKWPKSRNVWVQKERLMSEMHSMKYWKSI